MDEEKYTLSNWERKEIFVKSTEKTLPKLVSDALLNIRRLLIDKKVHQILQDIKNKQIKPDLEVVNNYTKLRKLLFEKLNRVV